MAFEFGELEFLPRFLQEDGNGTGGNETVVAPNDFVIVTETLITYGNAYLVFLAIFCYVRNRYPRTFNVRSWAPAYESDLAKDFFGPINWLWKVWFVADDDFREQCGMDALSFTRIYRFGLRVAFVGMFNSLWLMPIYATSPITSENKHITDKFAILTAGFIPSGSPRFLATVLAAYINFGTIMYLLLREFEWFTENRHKYLTALEPRNYTVYVSHIPAEYRSSAKLADYFRSCFSHDAVLEAQIALDIPNLEKQYRVRENLIGKLEHAINVEEINGKTPRHRSILAGSTKLVNSIETYTDELQEMNEEVTKLVFAIEQINDPMSFMGDLEAEGGSVNFMGVIGGGPISGQSSLSLDDTYQKFEATLPGLDEHEKAPPLPTDHIGSFTERTEDKEDSDEKKPLTGKVFSNMKSATAKMTSMSGNMAAAGLTLTGNVAAAGLTLTGNAAAAGLTLTGNVAAAGLSLIMNGQDGEPREAGFVVFANLKTTQAALQQIHHDAPFMMEVAEAPQPDDIFWANVGKSHKSLQLGKLASFALTTVLCLIWTVPVAVIASFTEVESLKVSLPFLQNWSDAWPAFDLFLAQLAPLVLIVVKSLLPIFLGEFSKLEGPVSSSVLESSLFVKLAIFEIIQTFFVSTFSGTITSEITNILKEPASAIGLLANSIPLQSSYFMQILFVQTFIGQGLELLRVIPIAKACARSWVGPNLTEKERNTTWQGIRPLADPIEFEFADVVSNGILYFMVIFVYGTLAPITNWFLAFCFMLMISGYRHQLIFNYPPTPDSGGQLWISFFGITQSMMLIAEITIIGYLGLKEAVTAVPFMAPLIIITVLFNFYIRQRHFLVSKHLPSRDALKKDLQNQENGPLDMSFVSRKYVQEAMQSKAAIYPENFSVTREMEQQQIAFMTPNGSEADIAEYNQGHPIVVTC